MIEIKRYGCLEGTSKNYYEKILVAFLVVNITV